MNAAVGLMEGLGLDGDRCIRVIPRQHLTKIGNSPKYLFDLLDELSEFSISNESQHKPPIDPYHT